MCIHIINLSLYVYMHRRKTNPEVVICTYNHSFIHTYTYIYMCAKKKPKATVLKSITELTP
jgi:hypothetical protein